MANSQPVSNQEIYDLRRQVESLRQQALFPVSAEAAGLLDELLQAEQRLAELERQQPPPVESGVLIDNRAGEQDSGGTLMGADTTGLEVTVELRMGRVPTSIVHLFDKDEHPLVTCRLNYTGGEFMRLRMTSWVEGYSAEAVDTLELTYKNREGSLNQLPTFFPEKIKALTELARATLHTRVENLDGGIELHSTHPIWLLARSSAYLTMRDPAANRWVDLRPYLAAWVTPNAPEVMELLRRAAGLHAEGRIVGYQVDPAGVQAQVQCIFEALKAEELTYVNSLASFGSGAEVQTQRVRLPREALQYRSANCIDGTVLMASVLEFASLNPGIAVVPGHAFLAWEKRRSQDGAAAGQPDWEALENDWDYLETTMIGSHDFAAANQRGRLLAEHYRKQARQQSNPHYFQLISLRDARANLGIMPME